MLDLRRRRVRERDDLGKRRRDLLRGGRVGLAQRLERGGGEPRVAEHAADERARRQPARDLRRAGTLDGGPEQRDERDRFLSTRRIVT